MKSASVLVLAVLSIWFCSSDIVAQVKPDSVLALIANPAGGGEIAPADFLGEILGTVRGIGGLPTLLKISVIITLLISSMKVSILNRWVWNRLGKAQAWVAPLLGLLAGVLGLGAGGAAITPALVLAYVTAGAGAVFLHEVLDSLKAVPGLGAWAETAISAVESLLGANAQPPKKD